MVCLHRFFFFFFNVKFIEVKEYGCQVMPLVARFKVHRLGMPLMCLEYLGIQIPVLANCWFIANIKNFVYLYDLFLIIINQILIPPIV